MFFEDRRAAGRQLGKALDSTRAQTPLVLALPFGGVLVADEVAKALGAPLDIWVAREIRATAISDQQIGGVAEGGSVIFDRAVLSELAIPAPQLERLASREQDVVSRLSVVLRRGGQPPDVAGRTVILVDDGTGLGAPARAALRDLRRREVRQLIIAAPVCRAQDIPLLRADADQVVALHSPRQLGSVADAYEHFDPVHAPDVARLLAEASRFPAAAPQSALAPLPLVRAEPVDVLTGDVELPGTLHMPAGTEGVVLFPDTSPNGRHHARNTALARYLHRFGIGTLLFDLLTRGEQEAATRGADPPLDVPVLTRRLLGATEWLRASRYAPVQKLGYCAGGSAAAPALAAAALRPGEVSVVVTRGGRPDLVWSSIPNVQAPTLLIVGRDDRQDLELNRRVLRLFHVASQLVVVPGTTRLEENGNLDEVARLAAGWFIRYLGGTAQVGTHA